MSANSQSAARTEKRQDQSNLDVLREITPPPAVMSASIIPQSNSDLQPVQDALMALARTDPSARIEVADGQLLVHGLGALHLEIIEGRLRDEWGVAFESGRRRVTYREAFPDGGELHVKEDWSTDLHGRRVTVHVELDIRALAPDEQGDPQWDGNVVLAKGGRPLRAPPVDGNLNVKDANNPLTYVAQGIASAMLSSPHTGFPLSRTRIAICEYNLTPHNVSFALLAGGASFALRRSLQRAGLGTIMEPYIRLKISVGEDHLGQVVKDLTEKGGEVLDLGEQSAGSGDGEEGIQYSEDGVYLTPEWMSPSAFSALKATNAGSTMKRSMHAIAPLSHLLDFNNRLRALSGGHGTFEMANAGFRAVSEARKLEILREIGRA